MTGNKIDDRYPLRLCWIAQGLGAVIARFWVFIGMLQAFAGSDLWTVESTVLAVGYPVLLVGMTGLQRRRN